MKTENPVNLGTENSSALFSTWAERTNDDDYDLNFQNLVLTKTILLTFYPHHQYLQGNQTPSQYWQLIPLIKEKYGIVPTRTYPWPGCQRFFMRSFRYCWSRYSGLHSAEDVADTTNPEASRRDRRKHGEIFLKKIWDTQPRPKGLSYRKWEELFPMFLRGKCWGGKVPRKV